MIIRIAGTADDSIVDGPGLRFTIFTQGCPHGCPGCHNPESHDFNGGTLKDPAELLSMIDDNPLLDGITLSGGEPFCQSAACAFLAAEAHARGLNVWTYSGWLCEDLLKRAESDPDTLHLLQETDVLADGPFILAQRSLDVPWRGSKNQRLIDMQATLRSGTVTPVKI